MKKILIMMLLGFISCAFFAQEIDSLKVFQGTFVTSIPLSNIDNMVHDDDGQFVRFYYNNKMIHAFRISSIDSIVFENAKALCYQIPEENLNGWDDGVFYLDNTDDNKSFYIVSHSDTEDSTRTVYLNSLLNDDITQSMAIVFSPNKEIQDIFIDGYQFEAFPNDENVTFLAYDKEGNVIDCFSVPYEEDSEISNAWAKSRRKALEHYQIVQIRKFLGLAGKTLWNVADYGMKFEDGKYADALKDFLLGRLVGLYIKNFIPGVVLTQLIDLYLKQLYENCKNWYMGSAGIEITSIKRTSKSAITVEGEISNISTIPQNRIAIGGATKNVVWYGVAEGKSGQPGLYLNDNCSNMAIVSDSHFTRTIYVEYQPGQTFYFRPFLIPEATLPNLEASLEENLKNKIASCIRYGERKEYTDQRPTCTTGEVVSKKDKSAVVKCSFSGAEGFECGVMVSSDSGTKKFQTSSEDGERPINLSGLSPATKYNYWAYVLIDGVPENGEVKSFTTNDEYRNLCPDENHPHAIDLGLPSGNKWCCCNVGASKPEDYGDCFTWHGAQQIDSPWLFPTLEEFSELITWGEWREWSSYEMINGVYGHYIKSRNGSKLFIPFPGDTKWGGKEGEVGEYWLNTIPYGPDNAWKYIYFKYSTSDIFLKDLNSKAYVRAFRK